MKLYAYILYSAKGILGATSEVIEDKKKAEDEMKESLERFLSLSPDL